MPAFVIYMMEYLIVSAGIAYGAAMFGASLLIAALIAATVFLLALLTYNLNQRNG